MYSLAEVSQLGNCCWQTKCNASHGNASHAHYVIFLVTVYTFLKNLINYFYELHLLTRLLIALIISCDVYF